MGLDMYLHRRQKGDETLGEEIQYWRKVNWLRRWIVDHTDYANDNDCVPFVLTKENVEALIADCEKVIKNKSQAPTIMPTQSGYFFGCTDYDEVYFDEIESVKEQFENVLNETDFEAQEIVYYEWW